MQNISTFNSEFKMHNFEILFRNMEKLKIIYSKINRTH